MRMKLLQQGRMLGHLPIGKRVQRILMMQGLTLLLAFLMLFGAYTENARQQQDNSFSLLNQTALNNTQHLISTLETTSMFPVTRSAARFQDELYGILRNGVALNKDRLRMIRLFEMRASELFLQFPALDSLFLYSISGEIQAFKVNNLLYNPIVDAKGLDWLERIVDAKGQLVLLEPDEIRDIGYSPTVHTLVGGRLLSDPYTFRPVCIVLTGVRTADVTVNFDLQKLMVQQEFSVCLPSGAALIGSAPFPVGEALTLSPTAQSIQEVRWQGKRYRCHLAGDEAMGVYCVTITPKHGLLPFPLYSQTVLLAIFLLTILINLLFVTWILRDITKPLEKLVVACKKLGEGDFATRVETEASDELGVVVQSFNQMSDHIEKLVYEVYLKDLAERDLELQMLRSQINPHFLYNTLESIRMAAYARGERELAEMNRLLANVLRYGVTSKANLVMLREELEQCRNYTTLLAYRYGDEIRVSYHIDPGLLEHKIIKLLFQPLIENSVNHGLTGDGQALTIRIWGYREDNALVFSVADDGAGLDSNKLADLIGYINNQNQKFNSIGLKNIQRRIQLYYGSEWGLTLESRPRMGASVTIRVPMETKEEETNALQDASCGR